MAVSRPPQRLRRAGNWKMSQVENQRSKFFGIPWERCKRSRTCLRWIFSQNISALGRNTWNQWCRSLEWVVWPRLFWFCACVQGLLSTYPRFLRWPRGHCTGQIPPGYSVRTILVIFLLVGISISDSCCSPCVLHRLSSVYDWKEEHHTPRMILMRLAMEDHTKEIKIKVCIPAKRPEKRLSTRTQGGKATIQENTRGEMARHTSAERQEKMRLTRATRTVPPDPKPRKDQDVEEAREPGELASKSEWKQIPQNLILRQICPAVRYTASIRSTRRLPKHRKQAGEMKRSNSWTRSRCSCFFCKYCAAIKRLLWDMVAFMHVSCKTPWHTPVPPLNAHLRYLYWMCVCKLTHMHTYLCVIRKNIYFFHMKHTYIRIGVHVWRCGLAYTCACEHTHIYLHDNFLCETVGLVFWRKKKTALKQKSASLGHMAARLYGYMYASVLYVLFMYTCTHMQALVVYMYMHVTHAHLLFIYVCTTCIHALALSLCPCVCVRHVRCKLIWKRGRHRHSSKSIISAVISDA